jgi:hypothetical protein
MMVQPLAHCHPKLDVAHFSTAGAFQVLPQVFGALTKYCNLSDLLTFKGVMQMLLLPLKAD